MKINELRKMISIKDLLSVKGMVLCIFSQRCDTVQSPERFSFQCTEDFNTHFSGARIIDKLSKINTFFPWVRCTIWNGHCELQNTLPNFWFFLPGHRKCLENLYRAPLSSAPVENLGQTMLISRNLLHFPTLDKRKDVLKWISNLASVHKVGDSS